MGTTVRARVESIADVPLLGGLAETLLGAVGGLPGLAGFFLADHALSDVVFPARDTTIALLEIEKAHGRCRIHGLVYGSKSN